MSIGKRLLFITALVLLSACSFTSMRTSVIRTSKSSFPPTKAGNVSILSKDEATKPYTTIAVIKVSGEDKFSKREDLINKLKAEAAKLGADAVINIKFGSKSTTEEPYASTLMGMASDNHFGEYRGPFDSFTPPIVNLKSAEGIAIKWE